MKNKTKETVRQFVGVSPEWEAAVVKTATGYDAVCKRTQGNEVQYGHTLCSFKYKKMLKRPPNVLWTFGAKCSQRRILNG